MLPITKGRYTARHATLQHDIDRAKALRHLCFTTHRGLVTATDADTFDAQCQHIVVEDTLSGSVVCTFRLMIFVPGTNVETSYCAQFYDLSRLSAYRGLGAELGRFCIHPDHSNPDIPRMAWGALTAIVDQNGVDLLFGCTSFDGADPVKYQDALAILKRSHLGPEHLRPGMKSPDAQAFGDVVSDPKRSFNTLPPLLRTYLAMGGWVSDHAVIDRALDTLHVFTGLEIAAIPPARARALRAIAALT